MALPRSVIVTLTVLMLAGGCRHDQPTTADFEKLSRRVDHLNAEVTELRSVHQVGRWQLIQPSGGGYVILFDTVTGRLFQPGQASDGQPIWIELQKPPVDESDPLGLAEQKPRPGSKGKLPF